ncbi:hypothetical protein [Tepidibacter thalassicus]|uniref:Uncharacterized protein n=1 Tax=Tepidibacter thalassicus DSM 15285 TaxID=1123350 RepID=A0A1M5NKR3_9FIRM|nr:hypothetical protein [Tepidibacter thalassicus]SHG89779.1 hypothetical protein SAMN02744040_00080 [Tepidibacter thalassicus DSM 15285]
MLVAENVRGFDKLEKNAELFKVFLKNFYNAWGLEARETIKPISVKYVKEKGGNPYLRFDYEMYGKKEWLHVTGSGTWY